MVLFWRQSKGVDSRQDIVEQIPQDQVSVYESGFRLPAIYTVQPVVVCCCTLLKTVKKIR